MNGTLNKVMLIGRMGEDIKLTYFDNGNCVGRFSLATDDVYTNKATNEKVTNTDWHTIVVRNKAAEVIEKYASKGDRIYVEGKLKPRQWQDNEGITRYTVEVHVSDFTFLQNKKDPSPPSENNKSDENLEDKKFPF
ncbi:MAG: single-stranded DNA-binding protein [Capnocytophaga sp.]|nr:single-stranded DNA-binding protein [Capnocytophaga sp.]